MGQGWELGGPGSQLCDKVTQLDSVEQPGELASQGARNLVEPEPIQQGYPLCSAALSPVQELAAAGASGPLI